MAEKDQFKFTILGEDGKEKECEILFTFSKKGCDLEYVVYTDNTVTEDNSTRVFAGLYDPEKPSGTLFPITCDEDYDAIENMLTSFGKILSKE